MPKSTFYNLSEEKQKKIFDAAIDEFSERRFSDASINQIIKMAEIPRGSFYQYFNDKEDLYLYIISVVGKEKLKIAEGIRNLNPEDGFFDCYLKMFKSVLEWAKDKPKYMKIGLLMEVDNSSFIEKLKDLSKEGFKFQKQLLDKDKERGLIKKDIDTELVVDMLYTLNMKLQLRFFMDGEYDKMLEKLTDIVKIIKGGIASV